MSVESDLRKSLLETAAAYAEQSGCALSTVSRRCRSEPGFFKRISSVENSFTLRTFDEVMEWFATNWPEGSDLPAHLRRHLVATAVEIAR